MSLMGILDRVADAPTFDKVIEPARRAVQGALRPQALKDLLHGTWLGHPLHPVLVHVPVGTWLSAGLLDLVPPLRPAATVLIGTGRGRGRARRRCPGRPTGRSRTSASGGSGRCTRRPTPPRSGSTSGRWSPGGKGRGALGRVLSYAGLGRRRRLGRDRRAHVLRAVLGRLARGDGGAGAHHRLDRPRPARRPARGAARRCAPARGAASPSRWPPSAAARGSTSSSAPARTCPGPLHEGTRRGGARARTAWSARWHGSAFDLDTGEPRRGPAANAQEKLEVRMEAGRVMARAARHGTGDRGAALGSGGMRRTAVAALAAGGADRRLRGLPPTSPSDGPVAVTPPARAEASRPCPGIEAEAVRLRTDEAIGGQVQVRITDTGDNRSPSRRWRWTRRASRRCRRRRRTAGVRARPGRSTCRCRTASRVCDAAADARRPRG